MYLCYNKNIFIMTREDFRIVAKYYSTNNLTYILYKDTVIDYVEIYSDNYFKEIENDKWESQQRKRKPSEITSEAEAKIKRYIANHAIA